MAGVASTMPLRYRPLPLIQLSVIQYRFSNLTPGITGEPARLSYMTSLVSRVRFIPLLDCAHRIIVP